LILVRKVDNDAIFRNNAADAGKVVLTKLSWYVPHVLPALEQKLALHKTIESKASFPGESRMIQYDSIPIPQARTFNWRLSVKSAPENPHWIIVPFQTNKFGNQERNPSLFDHCNLTNMLVMLSSRRYPEIDYDGNNFTQQKFSRVYGDAATFRTKFYGLEELVSSPNIQLSDFKELFPIFILDVSKQSEKLKNSVTDIQINAQFSENLAANTEAFAVVISHKSLIFQNDGQKMCVEY